MTIEEAEEFGKYAEEYGTMCYSQHKIVASNGKKLLSLLQGKFTPFLPPFTPLLPPFYPLFTLFSPSFHPLFTLEGGNVSTFDEKLNLLI